MKGTAQYFFILFLLCLCWPAEETMAQSFHLELLGNEAAEFEEQVEIPKKYNDYLQAFTAVNNALQTVYKKGFITAAADSIWLTNDTVYVSIFLGKVYQWAQLKTSNIPAHLLRLSGYEEKAIFNKPIKPSLLSTIMEKMIRYYENNGYPFATAFLDSVSFDNGRVSANLQVKQGPLIIIDTIILNDDAGIEKNFITNYLGIEEGALYDESKIRSISQLIRELPFLEESYPWKIYFGAKETRINLYLKNKSANRADVLIGLLPNNLEIGNKFLLTGDIKFAFVNALERGERIEVNWQNLQFQSPRLVASASYPYLLNTQIGISGNFDYYKKDTSFRTVNGELGFIYQFNARDQLKAFYETGSTRLITVNTSSLISTRRLPENADIRTRSFGLAGGLSRVDYRLNPRRGWLLQFKGAASIRDFLKNSTIESTFDPIRGENFSYLYDSLALRSYRFQLSGVAACFLPLGRRFTLSVQYNGGVMLSEQQLYRNEIFQIGGFRLLRGFDEGSLFVNNYQIGTIEPRYLLSQNSYFFLFSDVGFIGRNYPGLNRRDTPYSLGLGMVFETKAGLFNMAYAAGALEGGIQFKNSKIHFGYVNFF